MATIRDVARRAGVSPSTVSRVLMGSPHVREATREAVLEAVRALKFDPNALASGLRTRGLPLVGLIVPDITNPYYADLTRAVEDALWARSYAAMIGNSNNDPERELFYLRTFFAVRARGVIIAATPTRSREFVEALRRLPAVALGRTLDIPGVDAVTVDNQQAGLLATEHLLRLGHRRIAVLAGDVRVPSVQERLRGHEQALRQAGLSPDAALVEASPFSIEEGGRAMARILARFDIQGAPADPARHDRPTAVLCFADVLAAGAVETLREAALDIPRDMAVVAFDDTALARLVRPRLTTVTRPVRAMAEAAVRVLFDRIDGKHRKRRRVVLETRLVVRESCGGPLEGSSTTGVSTAAGVEAQV